MIFDGEDESSGPVGRTASDFRDPPVHLSVNIYKSTLRNSRLSWWFSVFSLSLISIDVKDQTENRSRLLYEVLALLIRGKNLAVL